MLDAKKMAPENPGQTALKMLTAVGAIGMICFFGFALLFAGSMSSSPTSNANYFVPALIFGGPILIGISLLVSVRSSPDAGKPRRFTIAGAAFSAGAGFILWITSREFGAVHALLIGGPVAYLLTHLVIPLAEQGDAVQPATSVDSKSEGSNKTKPEPKGRSQ